MKYSEFSEKQLKSMLWWRMSKYQAYDAIICDGSIRSGKTISMTIGFIMWSMHNFDNSDFAICGKTISSLRRNVIMHIPTWLEGIYNIKENLSKNYIEITSNGKHNRYFIFGGKDESSAALIQGMTLSGILFDEVALMPRSFVEQAIARCSVAGSKFWFNCNPENPQHWFKTEWLDKAEDKNSAHLHFTMNDNLSLSPAIKKRYESLYTGVFYDRFIRGLWCVPSGLVYQSFNNQIKDKLARFPLHTYNGQFFVSIDYGTINACSMGLWCINGKTATRIKEYYFDSRKEGYQKTDEEYYTDLEKLTKGYVINRIVVDPSAASFTECIRRHGKYLVWDAVNDVLNGIRATASLLDSGLVQIHENCKDSIREFGLYCWDEKTQEDKVVKVNDHAMDDVRYFCATILAREYRWVDWSR